MVFLVGHCDAIWPLLRPLKHLMPLVWVCDDDLSLGFSFSFFLARLLGGAYFSSILKSFFT